MKNLNLIFDLDGTLVDSIPGIENSIREALSEVTGVREIPELRNLIGPPIGKILATLFPAMDRELLARVESKFREIYNDRGWKRSILFQGMFDLLDRLHLQGDRLFVATNKPLIPTRKILEKAGLLPLMHEILCPDSKSPVFASKTEMIREMMQVHSLSRPHTLYIGDQPGDQVAAADCDILFVGVTYGYGSKADFQPQNCLAANNVAELEKIFQHIRTAHE